MWINAILLPPFIVRHSYLALRLVGYRCVLTFLLLAISGWISFSGFLVSAVCTLLTPGIIGQRVRSILVAIILASLDIGKLLLIRLLRQLARRRVDCAQCTGEAWIVLQP